MRTLLAALFALLSLVATPAAAQQERIERYASRAEIARDGSITVTETIRVQAQGQQIRRGIFRDIPTRFQSELGQNVRVGFDFLDASLDGRDVKHDLSRLDGGVRIRLGDPDTFLVPGSHTFRIRFRLRRAVSFFDDHDELYWNVVGDGWGFPIDEVAATIVLPEGGLFTGEDDYAGRYGQTLDAARLVSMDGNTMQVASTRPLAPREGLTVVARFPKGIVTGPSESELFWRKVADWAPAVGAVVGLMLVLAYYAWAYLNIGRDPRPGTIVPLFAPPDNMSAAAIRYVVKKGIDHRAFAAALVDAGVRGAVRIEETDGGLFKKKTTRIVRTDQAANDKLPPAELSMLNKLAPVGGEIEAKNENHEKFSKARGSLDYFYKRDYDGVAFKRNIGWAFAGLLAVMAALALVAAGVVWAEDLISPVFPLLTVAATLIAILLVFAIPEKNTPGRFLVIMLAVVAVVAAAFLAIAALPLAAAGGGMPTIALVLVPAGLVAISGFFWMDAPTQSGRALLDRIAGFKQYLGTTEGERFNRMQPAGEDLKLFERYLPYAIALGVEQQWADKFEDRLKAAAADPGRHDGFLWYSGSRNVWDNPGSFSTAIGASFASTLSTAAAAPSSGGSGGGGGFSGGGVGGGGGGGW